VEKHVLLVLATRANEVGECTPGIPRIAIDTGLSERSVHRALIALEKAKHIVRHIKPGVGTIYHVHPCQSVTPDTESPLTDSQDTPDTESPKQPRTPIIPQKATPSSVARTKKQTPVPSNFQPIVKEKSITAKSMAAWPPGMSEEQVEHFIDHHTAKGTLSKDWQASWRTWVKLGKQFNGHAKGIRMVEQPSVRGSRPDPSLDLLNASRAAEEAEFFAGNWQDNRGAWPTLPAIGTG
jgi:hypothetical protein